MKTAGKRARDYVASIGLALLIRKLHRTSYPSASAWGGRMGRLAFRLIGRYRRRAHENLNHVFGHEKSPDQLDAMVRILFENFFKSGFECAAYAGLSAQDKKKYVRIVGREKLDEALEMGRGVISLTAHLGNFLIMMARLAVDGYPVDLVVKPAKNERFEKSLQALREELGYHSIYATPAIASAKRSLAGLKRNHILVLFGDQRQRKAGVDVTFFKMPALAAQGPVSLALSTGAPILPMFIVRNQDGLTHTLYIEDRLEMDISGTKERDIRVNVQKYTDVIQAYVEKYPAQWIWDHKRWAR